MDDTGVASAGLCTERVTVLVDVDAIAQRGKLAGHSKADDTCALVRLSLNSKFLSQRLTQWQYCWTADRIYTGADDHSEPPSSAASAFGCTRQLVGVALRVRLAWLSTTLDSCCAT